VSLLPASHVVHYPSREVERHTLALAGAHRHWPDGGYAEVMIVVGAGSDPIEATPAQLLFGSRSIEGALTGSAIHNEETLAFSVLQNVRPMIETVALEKAAEAY
jgi:D-arabinose 1-dehydrogenase-like Zn-dependent alcohol dehydrogenase